MFARIGYNPDLAPIMGKDLNGLCPAMILTCGYDILRDHGPQYTELLKLYHVPVVYRYYKTAYHGIMNMPASRKKREMVQDMVAYLKSQLNLKN